MDESESVEYIVTHLVRELGPPPRPRISSPHELFDLIVPYVRNADREHFYGIYLSTKNHVLAVETVSIGSLSASIVHPRECLRPAVIHSAAAFAVAHNHPSGDPTPSPEDLEFTRRLARAGELLGIRLIDHVIVGDGIYESLKERGEF